MKTKLLIPLLALIDLLAVSATAQVNYAVSGSTAHVTYSFGTSGAIVIASTYNGFPVTSILGRAFQGSGVTAVTIPGSVTNIGDFAFRECAALTNISVDAANPAYSSLNGVLFDKAQTTLITFPIGRSGGYVIPNTVTSIVTEAFYRSFGLTNVTIPNSVTSIGSYVFYQCTGLKSVTIPDSVTSILFRSFESCSGLTNVIMGNSVTNVADYLFWGCGSLANVTMGNSVASIGVAAFASCPSLTSVTMPNSVTHIWDIAFYGTSLRNVTIPHSVTNIRDNAFSGCPGLTNFSVAADNPAYSSLDGVLFDKAQTSLITFPKARGDRSYVIPDSVTRIAAQVFSGMNLTNVTLGNSLTSIGVSAFDGCTGLTGVTLPNSLIDIGGSAFAGCRNLTGLTIPNNVTNIGGSAFSGCTNLTSLNIGNRVTSIGSGAFEFCRGLTNVILGQSVTRIGSAAFWRCTNVTSVTFPSSLTSIEDGAFMSCTKLTNFTFLGNRPVLIRGFYEGSWFAGVGQGAKAYYTCGTTGWGATYGGLPTVILCPPQIGPDSAGVKPGGFGFTLNRLTNQTVVEASTDLLNWQPIWTNASPGTTAEFLDPQALPNRFYRARSE